MQFFLCSKTPTARFLLENSRRRANRQQVSRERDFKGAGRYRFSKASNFSQVEPNCLGFVDDGTYIQTSTSTFPAHFMAQ